MPLLYRLLIKWPLNHYPTVNHISFIPLLVLLAASGALIYGIWRHPQKIDKSIATVLITVHLCLLISIVNRPDIPHILWNSFGILLLASHILYARIESLPPATRDIIFIDIPLMVIFSFSITVAIYSIQAERTFKKRVEKLSITSLYAHPFLPELYFELGVPDPYPYDILLSRMYSRDAFDTNLHILTREKPEYIFLNYEMASKFNYQKEHALDDYIDNHYYPIGNFEFMSIMKKK